MLFYTRLAWDEHSGLLGPFISYEEKKCVVNRIYVTAFAMLHFLCYLQMGPKSKSVKLHKTGKACEGRTL